MRKAGYALATILILLGVALFSMAALVTVSVLESKISRSHIEGTTAYYVAEAGVQDALWRLNTNTTYANALINGTLNESYTATDAPAAGQSFTVNLRSTAAGPGYGEVEVTGTSNNGDFIAKRRIKINVFKGVASADIGGHAFFAGGGINVTNSATVLQLLNGGMYATTDINISQATVDATGYPINTAGNYTSNNGIVYASEIRAQNYPPAPAIIPTPSFDFTHYSQNYTVRYTPSDFESLVTNSGGTVTLPGPVTFIDGNLSLGSWAKDKTINASGMIIINGTFSIVSSAKNFSFNITDPGDGKSGLFIRSNANTTIGEGNWNIQGVMYASGTITFTNKQATAIDGALVAGGSVTVNTGLTANLTYNATRVLATLGSTNPLAVEVQHWEEQY